MCWRGRTESLNNFRFSIADFRFGRKQTRDRAELSDFGAQDLRLNDELGEEELGSYGQELYDLCRHVRHGPVA